MIRSLRIDNFALIDAVSINFTDGFTVITGETGSGKSILLNALNLILGERANFSVIGDRKDKSVVEAEIEIKGFNLGDFFDKNQLDYFDTTIVRREIYKQGRSRAFINDVPVQLNILKEFMSGLIHIHSQYNTLELKDTNFQLNVLDVLAETNGDRGKFQKTFAKVQFKRKELKEKEQRLLDSSSMSDYNTFQLVELNALDLENTNYEQLQQELNKYENADELLNAFGYLVNALQYEGGVIEVMNQVANSLQKNESIDPAISELYKRVNSVLIELKDISEEAEMQSEKIVVDPQRLVELTAKLDAFNKGMLKHKVNSQEELFQLMSELSDTTQDLEKIEREITELKATLDKAEVKMLEQAKVLHYNRIKAVSGIETQIKLALADLKLENTSLEFRLNEESQCTNNGISRLEIYFSPNAGVAAVPIHQAASGGELSRVMLALQNLMSKKIKLKTILFDEIDTGVSGDVAQKNW